jgi:hypothetical protein
MDPQRSVGKLRLNRSDGVMVRRREEGCAKLRMQRCIFVQFRNWPN